MELFLKFKQNAEVTETNELLTYERNQEEEFEKFKTMSNKEILTFESTMYSYWDIP